MGVDGPFGYAGGAARILQEGDILLGLDRDRAIMAVIGDELAKGDVGGIVRKPWRCPPA